jgi:ribulose-phosphate 3-epimerase
MRRNPQGSFFASAGPPIPLDEFTDGGKILAPSILAYDNCKLADGIAIVEKSRARRIHVDVMDGVFVPTITFGQGTVRSMASLTDMFLDVHLMVKYPQSLLVSFIEAGASMVTCHREAAIGDFIEILTIARGMGCRIGMAINPTTPVSAVEDFLRDLDLVLVMAVEPGKCGQKFLPIARDKIRRLVELRSKLGCHYEISVDGGINSETLPLTMDAGADIFVVGSAFFADPEHWA